MEEMIDERQSSQKQERSDLFSSLLDGNNADTGEAKLTVSELIGMRFIWLNSGVLKPPAGNVFVFLVAGHEVCVSRGASHQTIQPAS